MNKVSVIMPSLNVGSYIRDCIESVVNQSLKEIQILVIDAGSEDGTLEILQEYAKRDKRVRIIHSEIKSYGYQINKGLSMADGEYIAIVETDDKIHPEMFKTLYEAAEKNKVDFIKGSGEYFWVLPDKKEWSMSLPPIKTSENGEEVIDPSKNPELLVMDNYLWTGLYKKEFVEKIKLNESRGAAFQDQGFLLQSLHQAKRAIYINNEFYCYRQDNINASNYNRKMFQYVADEYEKNEEYILKCDKDWMLKFYQRLALQTISRFSAMVASEVYWSDAECDMKRISNILSKAEKKEVFNQNLLGETERKYIEIFMKDPKMLFEIWNKKQSELIIQMKRLDEKLRGNQIVIVGCGQLGNFMYMQLKSSGIDTIVAYCDNNIEKHGTTLNDTEILSVESAVEKFENACFVIANKHFTDQITNQLLDNGINRDKITVYNKCVDEKLFFLK